MLDFLTYRLDLITLIILITTGVIFAYQIAYNIICLSNFNRKTNHPNISDNKQGVSVIIVTNNSADALKTGLLQILEQDYPLFEVIVVNENSTDDTEFVLYVLKKNYTNLIVINLGKNDNNFESYKFSLSIGIRSAKYSYCLLTNVSCTPQSYNWLDKMMNPINTNNQNKIVTGIVLREKSKYALLNAMIKYDESINCVNLISYTNLGNAYTSCGMNMIYAKDFFISQGGFIAQYTKMCNQEDYFVHRYSTKKNTTTVVDKEARLLLPAINSFKTFFRTKFATSLSHKSLKNRSKILLASNPLASFLFYILLVILFFFSFPWQYILIFIVAKWISQIVFCTKQRQKTFAKKIVWIAPFMEIFFFFFNFIIRVRVLFYRKREKKIRWKK